MAQESRNFRALYYVCYMKHFQVPLTLRRCITFIKESIVIIVINDIYFACERETGVPLF